MKTRVIVVDDSALVRSLLAEIINRQSDMTCIGAQRPLCRARDGARAHRPALGALQPDRDPRARGLEVAVGLAQRLHRSTGSTTRCAPPPRPAARRRRGSA
jgi:chemotaxis response regulator CheB